MTVMSLVALHSAVVMPGVVSVEVWMEEGVIQDILLHVVTLASLHRQLFQKILE